MNQKKLPVVSIIFFILAGVLLALSIWGAVYASNYISSLIDAGQLMVDGNEYELVSFHLSSYGQYVFFAIIMFGIGWIIYLLAPEEEELVLEDELFLEDEDVLEAEEPVVEEVIVETVEVDVLEDDTLTE
jgi:hypothetical protein